MLTDDIKLMQWGLGANALRLQVTAQNVANANTPGYKRQMVDFQRIVDDDIGGDALGIGEPPEAPLPPPGSTHDLGVQFARANYEFDQAFRSDSEPRPLWGSGKPPVPYTAQVITDPGAMRVDGNGVVIEREMADMSRASGQYNLLATRISGTFKILNTIIQAR